MLILEHCADTSSIWGTFDHTGQFMASDRTGLETPGTNRKCLTTKNGRLGLGHCHDRIRRQHFSFEYKNPHQTQTLSAAAIIAWHTEQRLNDKPLDKIPSLIRRDTIDKVISNKIPDNQVLLQHNASNTNHPTSNTTSTTARTTTKTTTATTSVRPTTTKPNSTTSVQKTAHIPITDIVNNRTLPQKILVQPPTQVTVKKPTEPPKTNTTTTTKQPVKVTTPANKTIHSPGKNTSTEQQSEKITSLPKPLQDTVKKPTEKIPTPVKEETSVKHTPKVNKTEPTNTATQSDSAEQESELPRTIKDYDQLMQFKIDKMHEQFKIRVETEHENKLAKEIRDMYCQVSNIKKTQAIILSQTNGILAAAALGLPVCSRIQGFGQTMILQQCAVKTISLTAVETQCGFQPYFTYAEGNFTIGMDGWSIHPYSDCFWKSHYVNLNGNPFAWEHNASSGEWVKQKPTIHTTHLDLIAEFEELKLNNFDFALKAHPAHNVMEMEQLNILNDLVGRLHETETKALSDIIVTEEQDNTIGSMFSWFDTLKIMGLCAIGFIIFIICIRIIMACKTISRIKNQLRRKIRKSKKNKQEKQLEEEMVEILNQIPTNVDSPEPVYSPTSITEPPFIRDYAPLPLEVKAISSTQPSAPLIQVHELTSEVGYPTRKNQSDKIYPSLATKLANFIPNLKFNQHSHHAIKSNDKSECTGLHTTCSYVAGYGMVWEDLCKCSIEEEQGALAHKY